MSFRATATKALHNFNLITFFNEIAVIGEITKEFLITHKQICKTISGRTPCDFNTPQYVLSK